MFRIVESKDRPSSAEGSRVLGYLIPVVLGAPAALLVLGAPLEFLLLGGALMLSVLFVLSGLRRR